MVELTFSKEIIEIIDYLGKQLGIAIDWSSKNVMPYLQDLMGRFVGFKMTESGIWMVISVLFIIFGLFLLKKGFDLTKRYKKHDDFDDSINSVFCFAISGFILIIFICIFVGNIFKVAECYFLPEKIVYDYIQTLLPN